MTDERENLPGDDRRTPRWMGLAVVGLAVLSLVGVGMAWNANSQAHSAEQALPLKLGHSSKARTALPSAWHRRNRPTHKCKAN